MDVPTLRVEGPDQPGIGERMLRAIADLGINLRGVSAAAIGGRFVTYIGFCRAD
jgi:predicted amino acid-binding ACT domain protein